MGYLTEEKRNFAGAIGSLFAGVSGQVGHCYTPSAVRPAGSIGPSDLPRIPRRPIAFTSRGRSCHG